MSEEITKVEGEDEVPTVVTQEILDANPVLAEAGVVVGSPILEATDEDMVEVNKHIAEQEGGIAE